MEIAIGIGVAFLFLAFWIVPVVLGIRAAVAKGVSPHWMWFGLHPFGAWIAFLVIRFGVRQRKRCPQCAETLLSHAKVCAYCGHPFDGSAHEMMPPSALSRRTWVILAGAAIGLVLIIGGFAWMTFAFASDAFSRSDAVREALARAQGSSALQARLGVPIAEGRIVSGSISESGPTGKADLDIPLIGPKGSGDLFATASKSAGVWSFTTLEFQAEDSSERLDLLKSDASPVSK